ncbi:MAG: hypothetical protein ABIM02_07335 [candidate division WOR-3 bacterium]
MSKNSFTIEEVKQLRNLNIELMETLIHTMYYIFIYAKDHNIPLPNENTFMNLLKHACKVIREINETIALPPNFQHRFRTPKDSTEPGFLLALAAIIMTAIIIICSVESSSGGVGVGVTTGVSMAVGVGVGLRVITGVGVGIIASSFTNM